MNFKELHRVTPQVYLEHAEAFDQQRSRQLFEKYWLDRFLNELPEEANVLDVGCGSAQPIAKYLIEENNINLTGVDASSSMIDIARSRYPDHEWQVMDMRALRLDQQFDGIIAWDSFFHLNPEEQGEVLPLFCQYLKVNGVFMTTIGDQAGEVDGYVNGQQVYHASLEPGEYENILRELGFQKIEIRLRDIDCGEHTVLLASSYLQ